MKRKFKRNKFGIVSSSSSSSPPTCKLNNRDCRGLKNIADNLASANLTSKDGQDEFSSKISLLLNAAIIINNDKNDVKNKCKEMSERFNFSPASQYIKENLKNNLTYFNQALNGFKKTLKISSFCDGKFSKEVRDNIENQKKSLQDVNAEFNRILKNLKNDCSRGLLSDIPQSLNRINDKIKEIESSKNSGKTSIQDSLTSIYKDGKCSKVFKNKKAKRNKRKK